MQPTYNRNKSRHNYGDITRVPRAGTKLRAHYDQLLTAPLNGWLVTTGSAKGHDNNGKLRDFYGCEIQTRLGKGGGSRLIGRWDNDKFISREQLVGRMSLEEYDQAQVA